MTRMHLTLAAGLLALFAPALALAEPVQAAGHAGGSGGADIELGAIQPSQVEMGAGGSSGARPHAAQSNGSHGPDAPPRLAVQLRLDALNMLAFAAPNQQGLDASGVGRRLLVPMVAPGVRFIDDKLFLGLGLGLSGASESNGNNKQSRAGWSLTPMATFDVLRDQVAALSLIGMINMARLGESRRCNAAGCIDMANDVFGWGLTLGAGLRGLITQGLALGGEFGWGFLDIAQSNGPDAFVHGLFGNLFLEASVGL
jgi:hypothetical protein